MDLKTLIMVALIATAPAVARAQGTASSLAEARKGVAAETIYKIRQKKPARKPPPAILTLVTYPAQSGPTSGYLTPARPDGTLRPAMIWVSGGDLALGDFWSPQPAATDQSAAAFRDAGLVVFYPSLRGLNGNPGQSEGFFGEVDDLIAATVWLKAQPGIDPRRVYLGGHSSGGTLVLLAAELADHWKGVFSFGPVRSPLTYGSPVFLPIDLKNERGIQLRSPGNWLSSAKVPTYVIEGDTRSNAGEVRAMDAATDNPAIRFHLAKGCTHFTVLPAASKVIASAIMTEKVERLDAVASFDGLCPNP